MYRDALIRFVKSQRSVRRDGTRRGARACVRASERFDRDRNTERKIRLNDESGAKFAAAYRKHARSPFLSHSLLLIRSLARAFRRRNFGKRSLARPRKLSSELNSLESFTIKCFPLISLITDASLRSTNFREFNRQTPGD